MKKKKQQTRNLIILAVLIVGIVLGLLAIKLNLNSNSNANYCPGGTYVIGGTDTCYELNAKLCSVGCCVQKVNYSKCKDLKRYGELKKQKKSKADCPGKGYDTDDTNTKCYLLNGAVCTDKYNSQYCCNKKVENKFCGI